MDISPRGIDLIFGSEGKHKLLPDGRYMAYLDTLAKPPVWTIYAGLTKGVREGMIITKEEGDRMFAKECAIYEDAVERLVKVPLNQNQFDALVSFTYNCGPEEDGLAGSTLLKLLNQGKYSQVPAQLNRWTHAGGVEYDGLVTRRKAEGALFVEPMPHELAPKAEEALHAVVVGATPVVQLPPVLPQRVEAAPVESVGTTITNSAGVKVAAVAVPGATYTLFNTAWEWISGIARDAGPQITTLKTTLSPFDALIKMTPMLLAALTVGCLGALIIKKIIDRRIGKNV